LRNRRLDGRKFRRQARIAHYVVDFYSAEEQLVVEVDGGVHAILQEADRGRDEFLQDLGLRVLRVRAQDVEIDLSKVLDMIRSMFHSDAPGAESRA
jgi:very-short-patch-repair endonuclease